MRWGEDYFYVEATQTEVIFYSEKIKILGDNIVTKKSVSYSDITSVSFSNTGGLTPRCSLEIRFIGAEKPYVMARSKLPGELGNKIQTEGETLKNYIESQMKKAKEVNRVIVQENNVHSSVEDLIKLKELLDSGLITIDEFNTIKSKMIFLDTSNTNITAEKIILEINNENTELIDILCQLSDDFLIKYMEGENINNNDINSILKNSISRQQIQDYFTKNLP